MALEETHHPAAALQPRMVEVQIESVDPFDVQPDMPVQQLRYRLPYHCRRPRLTFRHRATRRTRGYIRSLAAPSDQPGPPHDSSV